ncbi:hypothetical protein F7R20_15995 [Pseudomonas brassicacearum subsp. brassicacearum]|nr:hypothetical protein F7R20_15995 [Pseudomonas brassicacearum subsp. brassicacearum]PJH89151.1 hypothetical protein CVG87_11430 [Pseudomonas sp. WCS365]QEO76562.1 hypothetical protein ELZ14_02970 [Pseudomonas brassicacearum]
MKRTALLWRGDLWEQSLLAKQATGSLEDRIAFIAGKPCSHGYPDHRFLVWLGRWLPSFGACPKWLDCAPSRKDRHHVADALSDRHHR